jgi:[FeFe] hydrogenase H-cluster maturation GTPase HydF
MSLNDSPKGERIHIALFGKRNAGKSSIINALTGQQLAVVSDVKGTTTDPVYKAMELLPLGPVVFIDTPGLDDEGELGKLRVEKAQEVLRKTDIALLVIDGAEDASAQDDALLAQLKARKIPYLVVVNKLDLVKETEAYQKRHPSPDVLWVSTQTGEGIHELKERIATLVPAEEDKFQLVGDLLHPADIVVLVVPIDKAAPKGRLILPQQQVIRDVLEADAIAVVTKEYELRETLASLGKRPRMVITDSQVFAKVSADVPNDVPLTSFSILFARYKGDLEELVRGVRAVERLQDGDTVLIAEGCTHHRQCDDIGTVKIPRWLQQSTGKKLHFETSSGASFPADLSRYALVVHCGGCTLNRREMQYRLRTVAEKGIPIVNYGILIASMQGILKRSVELFPLAKMELED